MNIKAFYDEDTATLTYVVADPATKCAAIIDSVQDYDPQAGRTSFKSADAVIAYVEEQGYRIDWILETHIHADHLTAASYLKQKLGGKIAMGEGVRKVAAHWEAVLDIKADLSEFDHLFADGESFTIGNLKAEVMATPGHTPACVVYHIGDAVFLGDTLFMPRLGTSRADFPGGDAKTLYDSIQKIYALPDATRLFVCHDYPAAGEDPVWETTVGAEKAGNKMLPAQRPQAEYIEARQTRDATLAVPRLLWPSIQVNLHAGNLPEFIKIPLNKI